MNKICAGCGSILQTENELESGFIPQEKIENSNYCKRCFRLTHYGDITIKDKELSNEYILNYVNENNKFNIFMIDILNINETNINLYNKIREPKLLLISKIDLFNKSIYKEKIKNKLKKIYNIENIVFISSIKKDNVIHFVNYLINKKINNIFLLGPTNSGKSTFINKINEIYDCNLDSLTVSNKKNTTLEFIKLKLMNNLTIYDSPGFLYNDYNIKSKYKNIIKPITFNMKKDEIIFIDKFYIKFNNSTSITIYCYENINIKKFYKKLVFDYEVDIKDNTDLCINGFGFINIKNKCKIGIKNLNKEFISRRESVFGENHE